MITFKLTKNKYTYIVKLRQFKNIISFPNVSFQLPFLMVWLLMFKTGSFSIPTPEMTSL